MALVLVLLKKLYMMDNYKQLKLLIAEIGKLTWYRWMCWMKNCSTSFTR